MCRPPARRLIGRGRSVGRCLGRNTLAHKSTKAALAGGVQRWQRAMLRTGKQLWEAQAKLSALEIRSQELDFHIGRYTVLITQAGIEVAVTFMSLLHLRHLPEELVGSWVVYSFYIFLFASLVLATYVVVIGSVLIATGWQASRLGEEGENVELAVNAMRARRISLFGSGFLSLCCFFAACCVLIYIKLANGWYSDDSGEVTVAAYRLLAVAIVFCCIVAYSTMHIFLAVGAGRDKNKLIDGKTSMILPGGVEVDLAKLMPMKGEQLWASRDTNL